MIRSFVISMALVGGMFTAAPALAFGGQGKTKASYNVSIAGVRAGRMDIASTVNGSSYDASINLRSTGLLAALAKYRFKANARGKMTGAQSFRPSKYSEDSDTGNRKNAVTITYSGGVPKPSKTAPAPALKGSTQKGTVDPMTAIFAAFKDQPKAQLCKTNLAVYDGKRRTRLRLSPGKVSAKSATCNGSFQRLGGFTAKKMAEGKSFPLTITYVNTDGIYRVQSVVVRSARGRATFTRR